MILSDLDKQIMIVGSGGHAKVVADMVKLSGYKLLGSPCVSIVVRSPE